MRRKHSRFVKLIERITWTDAKVRLPELDDANSDLGDEPASQLLQSVVSSSLHTDLLAIAF